MEAKKEEMVPLDTSRAAFELWSIHNSGDSLPIEGAMWGNDWFYNDERTRAAYAMWRYLHRAYAPRVASVAPSQAPSSDAAILGWLNPETGKTCSVDEKHSMEKHQGMPGLHIAKGFCIPLIAACGVMASGEPSNKCEKRGGCFGGDCCLK